MRRVPRLLRPAFLSGLTALALLAGDVERVEAQRIRQHARAET